MLFPKKMTIIITDTHKSFLKWCKENNKSPKDLFILYPKNAKCLKELHNCKIVYYGAYWKNPLCTCSYLDKIQ